MIISHKYKFVFMHNPKVGGTSVRRTIKQFSDSDKGFYDNDPDPNSPTHRIDRAHMGIDEFRTYYPQDWDAVKAYQFYALWRQPKDRIYSSMQQYSRNFADTDIRFLSPAQRRDFLMETFDKLNTYGAAENILGEFELSHFRPQWIYLTSEEVEVAVNAIPLTKIDTFFADIAQRTGVAELQPEAVSNTSEWVALPGFLSKIAASRQRKALNAIPGVRPLIQLARRVLLDRERRPVTDNFGLSEADLDTVNSFVASFYAQDLKRLLLEQA